jgi:hypothetical protein
LEDEVLVIPQGVEIITREQVLEDKELLYQYMAQNNTFEFNMNKALEECVEFMEVLIKLQTKSKANPRCPSPIDAIHEFADVMLRGSIALMSLFPNDKEFDEELTRYLEEKEGKLLGWLEAGTYHKGL